MMDLMREVEVAWIPSSSNKGDNSPIDALGRGVPAYRVLLQNHNMDLETAVTVEDSKVSENGGPDFRSPSPEVVRKHPEDVIKNLRFSRSGANFLLAK
jgi:hypothetical protein